MITLKQSVEERREELREDAEDSKKFLVHKASELRRKGLTSGKFPARGYYYWKSPRGTRYMVSVYIKDKTYLHKGYVEFDARWYPMIDTNKGICIMDDTDALYTRSPQKIYPPHFWGRYVKRFGLDDNCKTIYEQFFKRSSFVHHSVVEAGSFSSVKHGTDKEVVGIHADGVMVGTYENGYAVYRSFLAYDELNKGQLDYVKKLASVAIDLQPYYDKLDAEAEKVVRSKSYAMRQIASGKAVYNGGYTENRCIQFGNIDIR